MNDPKVVTIYYPSKKWLEDTASEIGRQRDKHALESRYSPLLRIIKSNGCEIELKPFSAEESKADHDFALKLARLMRSGAAGLLKSDWARITALIECSPLNIVGFLDMFMSEKQKLLMGKLARLHCMTMAAAWRELGNNTVFDDKPSRFRYHYFYNFDRPEQWDKSSTTKKLDWVVNYVLGPMPDDSDDANLYAADKVFYLLPKDALIVWDFIKRFGSPDNLKPVEEIEDNLIVYEGIDFIANMPVFEGLKMAGIIKAGANKVPATVAKKLSGAMSLSALPVLEYSLSDRYSILANLGACAVISGVKGRKDDSSLSLPELAGVYLRAMYDAINLCNDAVFKLVIYSSVPRLSKRVLDMIGYSASVMAQIGKRMLGILPADAGSVGNWVAYDNVVAWMEFREAMSADSIDWLGRNTSFLEVHGNSYLYYPDYYARIKMPVINALIQMLAAIGLIDLAYEDLEKGRQEIRYVRISDAGLWIAGRVEKLKVEIQEIDDGLHFDPDTLMITIRDTKSPNYTLLTDLTEKISDNRFKITAGALLRGCKTVPELKARIDRMAEFFLKGKKSDRLDELINRLYADCNKVKPSAGLDYCCMDVDPDDRNLHAFLLGNPQIRKNTLRVEGWKLLVKKSFYPVFLEKLRQAGYLTES